MYTPSLGAAEFGVDSERGQYCPPERPPTDKKKHSFGSALALSAALHGALFATIGQVKEVQSRESAKKPDTPALVQEDREISDAEIANLDEENFEHIVERKVALARVNGKIFPSLQRLYEIRLKAYNELLFQDLMDDGVLDGRYIDFLTHSTAYNITLKNLRHGLLSWVSVQSFGKVFDYVTGIVKKALEKLPEDATELDRINAQNRAFVTEGVVRDCNSGLARFDHVLFEGCGGNCEAMSHLSIAVEEEVVGSGRYRFLNYEEHARTVYEAPDGERFAFNNNWLAANTAEPLTDDRGLEFPREVFAMQYLVNQGYPLEKFPEVLQKYWRQREGNEQGGAKTDTLYGGVPAKGYCYQQTGEDCFIENRVSGDGVEMSGGISEGAISTRRKSDFKQFEEMTLGEFLQPYIHVPHWRVTGNFSMTEHPSEDSMWMTLIEFSERGYGRDRLRDIMKKHLQGGALGQLYSFSRAQLERLREFILFGPPVFDTEKERYHFLENVLGDVFRSHTPEKEVAHIKELPPSYERARFLIDYMRAHHALPAELIEIFEDEIQQAYGHEVLEVLRDVRIIPRNALDRVLQGAFQYGRGWGEDKRYLDLDITELDPEVARSIRRYPWTMIRFPHLILSDSVATQILIESFHGDYLTIGDIGTEEAAEDFKNFKGKELAIHDGHLLTPVSAAAIAEFGGKLSLNVATLLELSEEVLEQITRFSGKELYIVFGDYYEEEGLRATHHAMALLARFPVKNLIIELYGQVPDSRMIRTLEQGRADKISIMIQMVQGDVMGENIFIDDETAKTVATASKITVHGGSENFQLKINQYRLPPSHLTREVEASADPKRVKEYVNTYQRMTPIMAPLFIEREDRNSPSGRAAMNQFSFVDLDIPSAAALRAAIHKPELKRYLNLDFNFAMLDQLAAQELFPLAPEIDDVSFEFVSSISPAVLEIITKGCSGKTLRLTLHSPLTPSQVSVLIKFQGVLALDIPVLNDAVTGLPIDFQGERLWIKIREITQEARGDNLVGQLIAHGEKARYPFSLEGDGIEFENEARKRFKEEQARKNRERNRSSK